MNLKVLAIAILVSILSVNGIAAEKTISLATTEWEPYVGRNLKGYGFTSEIIAEAFKRIGYRVRYSFMPPRRIMRDVESGKYDAGYPAYYSEERAKKFDYSDPFAEGPLGYYKRKDTEISYGSLTDLAPYKIGVCLGFAYPKDFEEAEYLKKEVARDEKLNLRKLLNRRIDLFITDKLAAQAAINQGILEGKASLEFMEPPLEVRKLHLIFGKNRGHEQKIRDFNAGLKMIIDDGTAKNIMKRHGFE